jgi:hypothetical protein
MTTIFNRIASLQIEDRFGTAVELANLRIAFDVEMTRTAATNTAKIEVWNLSRNTRDKLKERNARVRLLAGYSSNTGLELLFNGQAQFILHESLPPDIITTFECQDGAEELRQVRGILSYGNNTPARQVINDIAGQLGLPIKFITPINGIFESGYSFYGQIKNALAEVTQRFDLEWSLQNGQLQILKRGEDAETIPVFINEKNGLIRAPEQINYQNGQLNDIIGEQEPQWRITTLLRPKIVPASRVFVESRFINGIFSVDNVRHSGDTRGDNWFTTVEVKRFV